LPRPGIDIDQETCTVTGYLASDTGNDGIMREDTVNIVDKSQCSHSTNTSDTLVCGDHVSKQSDCQLGFDAGAPLACQSDGHYYLGGLVTNSSMCEGASSLFIKMSEFSEWLLQKYASVRY